MLFLILLALLTLGIYGRYEVEHDLPNPFWGTLVRDYDYVPGQVSILPPGLFDTRPDVVVRSYIADYIARAGTYPCVQNLAGYAALPIAPFEVPPARGCTVKRQVLSVAITDVALRVVRFQYGWVPRATVTFTMAYADGDQWTRRLTLEPRSTRAYFLTFLHMNCWDTPEFLSFYSSADIVPKGIFYIRDVGQYGCGPDPYPLVTNDQIGNERYQ